MCSEVEFIKCLTTLGRDLAKQPTREARTTYLHSQLSLINKNLPAKVWIPLYNGNHHVLSIPPRAAAVLNSKDKVNFFSTHYYLNTIRKWHVHKLYFSFIYILYIYSRISNYLLDMMGYS